MAAAARRNEAEEAEGFWRFPRTPHVAGSATTGDDDEVVSCARLSSVLNGWRRQPLRVCVQEKVDGANVGVSFRSDSDRWAPHVQKRSGPIRSGERHAQYGAFRQWAAGHSAELWALLGGTRRVLFGEWLWARHGVAYDALPGFFAAFDVFDKPSRSFLPAPQLRALVSEAFPALPVVPLLWEGAASDAAAAADAAGGLSAWLRALIPRRSAFGTEAAEGVVLRVESAAAAVERFKCRRPAFVAGRADFATTVVRNSLAPDADPSAL